MVCLVSSVVVCMAIWTVKILLHAVLKEHFICHILTAYYNLVDISSTKEHCLWGSSLGSNLCQYDFS